MSTAFVFPGQGAQTVGMGRAVAERSPAARAVWAEADAILGFSLSTLCWEGPASELTATWNAQPALFVASVAAYRAATDDGLWPLPDDGPTFVAGHSLGEYSALVVAGAATMADALRLVRRRGELMHRCGESTPSTMAAVLGLDEDAVRAVCERSGAEIANLNAPGQIVISGPNGAVAEASALALAAGAKRVLPLSVSAAFHSSVMRPAADELAVAIAATPIVDAAIPLVGNVDARPKRAADELRRELTDQLCRPVQWQRTIEFFAANGVTRVLEIGVGTVLSGLVKRIAPNLEAYNPVERALGRGLS
ncbi:MAG: ACP S-malonyltransferase [Dehalococcoidia bacterium]|nr:ACP S-malonyltransferase [Dehalococcoidia bacterium]